jgi:outer membrane immunogenic protein
MKRVLLASVAVVLTVGAAMAADMSVPFKAAPLAVAPTYNWTGCYLGIHGGGAAFRDNLAGTWSDGGLFGGQAGCNYQIDHLVVGFEGEGTWSGVDSTQHLSAGFFPGALITTLTFKNEWDADIAARFGIAYDRFFFYGKVGVMWGDHRFTANVAPVAVSGNATVPGFMWGFGLEYGLTPQWTAKFETDFIQFAATDVNLTCAGCLAPTAINSVNSFAVMSKIGINYRW